MQSRVASLGSWSLKRPQARGGRRRAAESRRRALDRDSCRGYKVDASCSHKAELRAKLTFYFQIRNGKGVVLNPEQVPGNEDVFAAWSRPPAGRGGPSAPTRPPAAVRQHDGPTREIGHAEFMRLLADADTVLLDVRDRDQFAGTAHPRARNLPFDEVLTRARAELPSNAAVVIDCSRIETSRCRFAHDQLRDRGFADVFIYLP